ncbi:hypothetical protein ACE6H2_023493 [Prunus campanulata]
MGSWRGQQGYISSQQHIPWTKPQNRKPPHDSWQFSVPHWERKFCSIVGSVPWGKLIETKKYMYLYENIVQWNDSAGEEAFNNAKSRFWAEINGLHCSISLPDPDIYIDDIDWNSSIDPELVLDLEREPKPSDDKTQEDAVILGNPLLLNQSFSCTGWGDEEEDFKNKENPENWNRGWNEDNKENPWEPVSAQSKAAVGGWDNNWENNASEWKNNTGGPNNMYYRRTDGAFGGKSDANSRKKEGGSWYNSRYKTSRFNGDYYQKDRGWRNGGRRNNRVHVGYENLA